MHRLAARGLGRCDHAGNAQVALGGRGRPDTDRVVGHPHVQRAAIGRRIDSDRRDTELVKGADHPHGALAPVRDEDPAEHQTASSSRPLIGSSSKSSWPYSTGSALPTWIFRTTASTSDLTSFISFIASRMQNACPAATAPPSSTNGGDPGAADR